MLGGFTLALMVVAGWSAREARAVAARLPDECPSGAVRRRGLRRRRPSRALMTGFAALGLPLGLHRSARRSPAASSSTAALDLRAADAEAQPDLADRPAPSASSASEAWRQLRQGARQDRHRRRRASWSTLWAERDRLEAFAQLEPAALLPATLDLAIKLMARVLAVFAVIARRRFRLPALHLVPAPDA